MLTEPSRRPYVFILKNSYFVLRFFRRHYISVLQKHQRTERYNMKKSHPHRVPVSPLGLWPAHPPPFPGLAGVQSPLPPSLPAGASPQGQTQHPQAPDLKHFLPCSLGGQTTYSCLQAAAPGRGNRQPSPPRPPPPAWVPLTEHCSGGLRGPGV